MHDKANRARFESTVLVHLDAAYNLARWLTRDAAAADDAVQEACLRAFRFFDSQQRPQRQGLVHGGGAQHLSRLVERAQSL